jgi:hypothetical protein
MHARDLIEVAGLVAYNGPQMIAGAHSLAPAPLEQYWAVSKCRFENWNRTLKLHSAATSRRGPAPLDDALDLRATLDEIFISEILVRVWTTVLVGRDRRMRTGVDEPLARNVFESHMEARHRALKLLVHSNTFTTPQAVAINRLRRRAERWSDVLIGGLLGACDVDDFAVDAERAADFADDLAHRRRQAGGRHAWSLTLVSLRGAFQKGVCPVAANPDTNARVTASILGCFPGELFDSTGILKSLWMMRLSAVASDAQGLIDDLLHVETSPDKPILRRR